MFMLMGVRGGMERHRVLPATFGGSVQMFMNSLTRKAITIDDIEPSDSIDTLKLQVYIKHEFILSNDFRLIIGHRQFESHHTLSHDDMNSGNTIFKLL